MTATIKDIVHCKADAEFDMASREIRMQMAEAEKLFQRNWPHRFVFLDAYECRPGEGTTDAEFARINEWVVQFAGKLGDGWTTRGDSIGVSLTYGFKDPDVAARFKLSFPTGLHQK